MDYHLVMRYLVFQNLKLLGFDEFCAKSRLKLDLNPDCFDKMSQKQFHAITYFLFARLNKTECKKRFLGCYPALDRKQESDFRQRTHQWFQELAQNELNSFNGKVAAIFFQNPGGDAFTQLYLELSTIILAKTAVSLKHKLGVECAPIDMKDMKQLVNETRNNVQQYNIEKQIYSDKNTKWDQHFDHFKSYQLELRQNLAEELEKQNNILEKASPDGMRLDKDSIDGYLVELSDKVAQLSADLERMNSVVENNRKIYDTVLNLENNSSDTALIESDRIFSKISANDIQLFQTRLTEYYQSLTNVDETNLKALSENSSKLLDEANHYKEKISEITNKFDAMNTSLSEEVKQTREQLLKDPKIIERRQWFSEKIGDLKKINLKFGAEYAKPSEKVCANDVATKFAKEFDDKNSPVVLPRASILNYSFKIGDLSSYGYVPPSGAISDESLVFSPLGPQTDD